MRALLMHPEHDFDAERALPAHAETLRQDLALDVLLEAMADDDAFIRTIACNALMNGPGTDADSVRYRQAAVHNAISHRQPVQTLYAITTQAMEDKRKTYWGFTTRHPSIILYSALQAVELFTERLRALREVAAAHASAFESTAFRNLFALLEREFDDAYLARVQAHLTELQFPDGALVSVRLGPECESEDYTLRRPRDPHANWFRRLLEHTSSAYTVRVAPRDMVGAKTLGAMRDRGVHDAARAVAQAAKHMEGFFKMLRVELAFHVGCANLHARLAARGAATCFPDIVTRPRAAGFKARALRDVALALTLDGTAVANDVDATGKDLIVITGANQGGKSTFLRGLGLAQLMLHAGMFVTAEAFAAPPASGVFTHYKREEDSTMRHGKLDEELARLGTIADVIRPGAWLLSNESFAATNEREGSELARQMIDAMRERGIRIACVTHLYTLAHGLNAQQRDDALFLRAERLPDGTRTFRLHAGMPRETSFGEDLYREVFGDDAMPSAGTDPGAACSPGVFTATAEREQP
jgi:hypothetical protein